MKRSVHEIIEVVTVGLPFCAFKVLTGLALLSISWPAALGYALVGLGAIDGAVNLVNLAALAAGRPRPTGICLTQILIRRVRPGSAAFDDLGIAVDVMLSFVLVAVMIGFGLLGRLDPTALRAWSVAVVLNVLGAGVSRLSTSVDLLRARDERGST